ncbi:UNKNOWN [Stylonychia lemnae]|uniref:Uncharacterized protein n=1 Tax=Stylonychia lemnae TaxID=5949 RepID=A0A078AT98_STYLE|nr:UNKNOWN [Stylonychia lemnae]|eukprot:CDW84392.1 UNKNOWN [Stylonychia lemnae]
MDSSDDQDYDGEDESDDKSQDDKLIGIQKVNENSDAIVESFKPQEKIESSKILNETGIMNDICIQQDNEGNTFQVQQINLENILKNDENQGEKIKSMRNPKPPIPLGSQRQKQNLFESLQGDINQKLLKLSARNQSKKRNQQQSQKLSFAKNKIKSAGASDESTLTNPNSTYRKLFNRNLKFFLWVIEKEEPPYIFKMHIQSMNQNDIDKQMIIQAIKKALLNQLGHDFIKSIDVRTFQKKNQFKVFLEIEDRIDAQKLFKKFFKMSKLSFFDQNGAKLFDRDMRAYLVKDEATFERLANQKLVEDGYRSNESKQEIWSKGSSSSIGSCKGRGSILNSSDESTAAKGNSNSQRGSGRGSGRRKGQGPNNFSQLDNGRNNSAENILDSLNNKISDQESNNEDAKEEQKINVNDQPNNQLNEPQVRSDIPKPPNKKRRPRKNKKKLIDQNSISIEQIDSEDQHLKQESELQFETFDIIQLGTTPKKKDAPIQQQSVNETFEDLESFVENLISKTFISEMQSLAFDCLKDINIEISSLMINEKAQLEQQKFAQNQVKPPRSPDNKKQKIKQYYVRKQDKVSVEQQNQEFKENPINYSSSNQTEERKDSYKGIQVYNQTNEYQNDYLEDLPPQPTRRVTYNPEIIDDKDDYSNSQQQSSRKVQYKPQISKDIKKGQLKTPRGPTGNQGKYFYQQK